MIEVELPDGTIAEFPDETPQDTIKGVLRKRFGKTDQPWYADAAQAADDQARLFASGASFGFADKFAGAMGGDGTEAERAKTQAARDRAGFAGTLMEVGGAVATPVGLANQGLSLAGRFGTSAMKGIPGLLARSGLMATEGAGYGALTAKGNDQDVWRGAGMGSLAGGAGNMAGEALSAGVSKVAGAFNKKPAIPGLEEISAAKAAAYRAADDAGVVFNSTGLQKLRGEIIEDFTKHGFLPANEPGAAAVLKEIDKIAGGNVTLTGIDTIRKMAGNAYIQGNKSNNALTAKLISRIDEFVANPPKGAVIMGDGQAGALALQKARSLAAREFKLNKVQEALDKAELRAASTGSGGNLDNATRQNLRRILEKPRGLTQDEVAALNKVVRGTTQQNALRLAGKLSPSGNGLMAALGIGGTMVNPMIGVASLSGMGAKTAADAMTKRNTNELLKVIAAGGSRAATQAPKNAVQALAESKREALARALMALGVFETVSP